MTRTVSAVVSEARRIAARGVAPALAPEGLRAAVGIERGELAEQRVCRLIEEATPRPWWLLSARRATPEEDGRGVDVVVLIADGPRRLHLQVKSSILGANEYRRRARDLGLDRRSVRVVIAPPEVEDAALWGRVLGALIALREAWGL